MFDRIWIDAGGTNVRAIGETNGRRKKLFTLPASAAAVPTAVRRVRGQLNVGGAIVVGLRGTWTAEERSAWNKKLDLGRTPLLIMSDIELAHAMAFDGGVGIVLNAGTGSIAFGCNAKGQTARAGGLGPLLGDDGSAFWIGREYIRRVESKTKSFSALRALAVNDNPVAAIAARARAAMKAARRGGEAKKIILEAKEALLALVRDVQKQLGGGNYPLALRGGLFDDKYFRETFTGDKHGR